VNIKWSRYALSDLSNIGKYIADDSPQNALVVMKRIREKAMLLEGFPELGVKSDIDGIRKVVVSKATCSIFYKVDKKELVVLRVIHHRRQWSLSNDDEKTILELLQ